MKYTFALLFTLLVSTISFSQAPQLFNYQGVARDLMGTPIPNKEIGIRVGIRQGSPDGLNVYTEIHNVSTSQLGLFSIQIGEFSNTNQNMSDIPWGLNDYFLQIEIDEKGGDDFQLVGTSQLLSVPYALYAHNGSKWNDSQFNDDIVLQTERPVIIGKDKLTASPLLVNNAKNSIGIAKNTVIAHFRREYDNSVVSMQIYGYPDTELVANHLRRSVMLYTAGEADDLILCSSRDEGTIRFFTQSWSDPNSERMIIDKTGNVGIGTSQPKSKLQVEDGDIYIEDINKGVIMKSPNGQCWRMTISDMGETVITSVVCP